jgi:hypothetical protein
LLQSKPKNLVSHTGIELLRDQLGHICKCRFSIAVLPDGGRGLVEAVRAMMALIVY